MFIEKLGAKELDFITKHLLEGLYKVEGVTKLNSNNLPEDIKSNFKNANEVLKIEVSRSPSYRYFQGVKSNLYLSDFNLEFVIKKGVSKVWSKTEPNDFAVMKKIYLNSMARFFGEKYLQSFAETKKIDKQM